MKKALALILALVLVLSMAVSAFALTLTLEKVEDDEDELTEIFVVGTEEFSIYDKVLLYEAGEYYFALDPTVNYEDIKVTANGNLTAELVKFDPETMELVEVDEDGNAADIDIDWVIRDNKETWENADEEDVYEYIYKPIKGYMEIAGNDVTEIANYDPSEAVELNKGAAIWDEYHEDFVADWVTKNHRALITEVQSDLEDYAKKANRFEILPVIEVDGKYQLAYINVIKVTVEDNYSAHYTEGDIEIEATLDDDKYSADLEVIVDVSIFEYEEVLWAGEKEETLIVWNEDTTDEDASAGYSDFWTDLFGYDDGNGEYDEVELRMYPWAAVVSTTAFRALAEKEQSLTVESGFLTVEIDGVEKGQKGVNFVSKGISVVDVDGEEFEVEEDATWEEILNAWRKYDVAAIEYGFLGDQTVKGDFTVTLDIDLTWFQLRELFGEKVEEDDIVTFYVLKDGKFVKGYEIDFMTADIDEVAEIEVELADTTLGEYEIVLEIPAGETAETNPNTGAESVVGVAAALAVVSLATAAAVSLKK